MHLSSHKRQATSGEREDERMTSKGRNGVKVRQKTCSNRPIRTDYCSHLTRKQSTGLEKRGSMNDVITIFLCEELAKAD